MPATPPKFDATDSVDTAARLVTTTMAELAEDPWAPPKFDAIAALTERFNLQPHPEGGFYAETYRASAKVSTPAGERNASTAIYFLITPGNVSRLHRIKSDEAWHFYLGGPMTVVELVDGTAKCTTLGQDVLAESPQVVQYVVKANTWFGSFPNDGTPYSLVGCTVAPGFDFADFELGSRAALLAEFPSEEAKPLIEKLTVGLP